MEPIQRKVTTTAELEQLLDRCYTSAQLVDLFNSIHLNDRKALRQILKPLDSEKCVVRLRKILDSENSNQADVHAIHLKCTAILGILNPNSPSKYHYLQLIASQCAFSRFLPLRDDNFVEAVNFAITSKNWNILNQCADYFKKETCVEIQDLLGDPILIFDSGYNELRFQSLFDKLKETSFKCIRLAPQSSVSQDYLFQFCSKYGSLVKSIRFNESTRSFLEKEHLEKIVGVCPHLTSITLEDINLDRTYNHLLELNVSIAICCRKYLSNVEENEHALFLKEAYKKDKSVYFTTDNPKLFSLIPFESVENRYDKYLDHILISIAIASSYEQWKKFDLTPYPHLCENETNAKLFIDSWLKKVYSKQFANNSIPLFLSCLKKADPKNNPIIKVLREKIVLANKELNELPSSQWEDKFLRILEMALYLNNCMSEMKELDEDFNELLKNCCNHIKKTTGIEIDSLALRSNPGAYCAILGRNLGPNNIIDIQLDSVPSEQLIQILRCLYLYTPADSLHFKSSAQGDQVLEILKTVSFCVEALTLTDQNLLSLDQFKAVMKMCKITRWLKLDNFSLSYEHYVAIPKWIGRLNLPSNMDASCIKAAIKDSILKKRRIETELRQHIHLLDRDFIDSHLDLILTYYHTYSEVNELEYPKSLIDLNNIWKVLKYALTDFSNERQVILLKVCRTILSASLPNEELEYQLLMELNSKLHTPRELSVTYEPVKALLQLVSKDVIQKNFNVYLEILDKYKLEIPENTFTKDNIWIGYQVALERTNDYFLNQCALFLEKNDIANIAVFKDINTLQINSFNQTHTNLVCKVIASILPYMKKSVLRIVKNEFESSLKVVKALSAILTELAMIDTTFTDDQVKDILVPCEKLQVLVLVQLSHITNQALNELTQLKELTEFKISECRNITQIPPLGRQIEKLFVHDPNSVFNFLELPYNSFKILTVYGQPLKNLSFVEQFSDTQVLEMYQCELTQEAALQSLQLAMKEKRIRSIGSPIPIDLHHWLTKMDQAQLMLNIHKLFYYLSSFKDSATFGVYLQYYIQNFQEKYTHMYYSEEEFRKTVLEVFPPNADAIVNLGLHPSICRIDEDNNLIVSTVTLQPLHNPYHLIFKFGSFSEISDLVINFLDTIAIDATGPRRQFFMNLFQGMMTHACSDFRFIKYRENKYIPELIKPNSGLFGLTIIGRLLAYCIKEKGAYPIGELFHSGFYRVLTSLKKEEIEQHLDPQRAIELYDLLRGEPAFEFEMLKTFFPLKPDEDLSEKQIEFLDVLSIDHQKKWKESVSDSLKERFFSEIAIRILPIQAIAYGMKTDLTGKDPLELEMLIQGTLTKEAFLSKIDVTDPNLHRWVVEWVQEHSIDELRNIVIAATGGPGLSGTIKFKLEQCDGMFAQTCFGIVIVSRDLTQLGFNLEMNAWAAGQGNTKFHKK